jgi:hypothetical protein
MKVNLHVIIPRATGPSNARLDRGGTGMSFKKKKGLGIVFRAKLAQRWQWLLTYPYRPRLVRGRGDRANKEARVGCNDGGLYDHFSIR